MQKEILIGTRNSPLAIAQAEIVRKSIIQKYNFKVEIVTIKTEGDKNSRAFSEITGIKGLFTYELEKAILNHEIDFAVHSLKDMSVSQNPDLEIKAYSKREDPRDVLILNSALSELPSENAVIASSSLRRKLQLKKLFPDLRIENIRGNINTRIKKLDTENFSGIVLAAAGLKRLNLENKISKFFSVDEIMPSPGQGVLACQGRRDEDYFYLESVNDKDSESCSKAERKFAEILGAGCNVPVGAYAFIEDENLFLKGLFINEESGFFIKESVSGNISEAEYLGEYLAEKVLKKCSL